MSIQSISRTEHEKLFGGTRETVIFRETHADHRASVLTIPILGLDFNGPSLAVIRNNSDRMLIMRKGRWRIKLSPNRLFILVRRGDTLNGPDSRFER